MRRRRAPYSVYLGARLLHDARPPLPFPSRPRAEFLRWAALGHQAEGLHLALSLRALDQLVQLRIEQRDDFPGYSRGGDYSRAGGRSHGGITALGERRNVGELRVAARAGDREGAYLAVLDPGAPQVEEDVGLSRDHRGERRRSARIGNV